MIARALTVAGSDSGGGAGIQQDLKTFQAHDVWGLTALTAVTVQDTAGVHGWHRVPPDVVAGQIEAVAADVGVDAAKTGMLPDAEIVEAVARALTDAGIRRVVVDPVMVATSGDTLTTGDAVSALVSLLLPNALLVTPNTLEAGRLTGMEVRTRAQQEEAGRVLVAMGARAALVTGGHASDDAEALDVLVHPGGVEELRAPRTAAALHGAGCMLSAAVAANLARGADLVESCAGAKAFVTRAIERARAIGAGAWPVDAGWERRERG